MTVQIKITRALLGEDGNWNIEKMIPLDTVEADNNMPILEALKLAEPNVPSDARIETKGEPGEYLVVLPSGEPIYRLVVMERE